MFKKISIDRWVSIIAVMVLTVALYTAIFAADFTGCGVPFVQYVVPSVHGLCLLFCIFLVIFPHYQAQALVCLIEGILTLTTGLEHLGLFLYSIGLLILFVNNYFAVKTKPKVLLLIIVWFVFTPMVLFYDVSRFLNVFLFSFLAFALYFYFYKKLESNLNPNLTSMKNSVKVNLPPLNSQLKLSDYGLTERQCRLVFSYVTEGNSYEKLADRFILSVSLVKKEMNIVCRIFGVETSKDLKELLSHYNLSE